MPFALTVTNELPLNRSVSIRLASSGLETRMKEVAKGTATYILRSDKKKACNDTTVYVLVDNELKCFLFSNTSTPKNLTIAKVNGEVTCILDSEKAERSASIDMESYVNGCASFFYSPYQILQKKVAKPKAVNGYVSVQ